MSPFWFRQRVRLLAYVRVVIRILITVAVGLALFASAASPSRVPYEKHPTEPYVLMSGETVASVAQKHGLTVESLFKLNELRSFPKPFSSLTTGDEIDVPRRLSRQAFVGNTQKQASVVMPEKLDVAPIARFPTRPDSAAEAAEGVGSAVSMAQNMAAGAVGSAAQRALGQLGTARVQLNASRESSLNGSQVAPPT